MTITLKFLKLRFWFHSPIPLSHITLTFLCGIFVMTNFWARLLEEDLLLVLERTKLSLPCRYCIWWGLLKGKKANFKMIRQ